MNNPSLFEYLMKHMTDTTKRIEGFLDGMPGTPEEKQMAYSAVIQYYESVVQHLNGAEALNIAACTLYDMREEEKTKKNNTSRPLVGFDSIRPGQYESKKHVCICGNEMTREENIMYPTYPSKWRYVCDVCGGTTIDF